MQQLPVFLNLAGRTVVLVGEGEAAEAKARLVTRAGGRSAVKLSDNIEKATGDRAEIERYLRVFGEAGRGRQAVRV